MERDDSCCGHDRGHNHSHDLKEFDWKKTLILIAFSTVLFFIGVLFGDN